MRMRKRFFKKSHSIYDCCRIVYRLQFLFGCSGISRRQSDNFWTDKPSFVYTIGTAALVVSALLASAYMKFQDPYFAEMDTLVISIVYLELGLSLFMYVTTVASMLANSKAHFDLYKRLYNIDNILVKEFSCNMRYDALLQKHLILLAAIGSIYVMIIMLAASRSLRFKEFVTNAVAAIAYAFVTAGPHLNGYAQMNVAEILRIRLRLLQKLMLRRFDECSKLSEHEQLERLQRLIEVVKGLTNCISICNSIFTLGMLATMLHDFTLITSELYLIFGGSASSDNSALIYFVILGLLVPVHKITSAPIYSQSAMDEVDRCFKVIKDLDLLYRGNKKAQHMVFASLMWRQDNTKQFTCGSMIMRKALIGSVYMEIFNYILILVQFRMTQDLNKQLEGQKDSIQDWVFDLTVY